MTPDEHRAKLLEWTQETITASGRKGDALAMVAAMVSSCGFGGLFDAAGALRVNVATLALQAALPSDPVAESKGPANWYGFGSEAEFQKLPPLTRLKLFDQYRYDANSAAKRVADAAADAAAIKNMPPVAVWATWSPQRKIEWHYEQQAAAAAAKKAGALQ